jgi:hypothetical protein
VDGMSEGKHQKHIHVHAINCKKAETENEIGKYTVITEIGIASAAYLY